MGRVLHGSARTAPCLRAGFQASQESTVLTPDIATFKEPGAGDVDGTIVGIKPE